MIPMPNDLTLDPSTEFPGERLPNKDKASLEDVFSSAGVKPVQGRKFSEIIEHTWHQGVKTETWWTLEMLPAKTTGRERPDDVIQ